MKTVSKVSSPAKAPARTESNRRRLERTLKEMMDTKREFGLFAGPATLPYRRIIE